MLVKRFDFALLMLKVLCFPSRLQFNLPLFKKLGDLGLLGKIFTLLYITNLKNDIDQIVVVVVIIITTWNINNSKIGINNNSNNNIMIFNTPPFLIMEFLIIGQNNINNNDNLFLGITVDPEYGGSGLDAVAAVIAHEELSASDPAFCLSFLAHSMLFVNNLNQVIYVHTRIICI